MDSLLLDERIAGDGAHVRRWARIAGDRVRLSDDAAGASGGGELPVIAVERVMLRFGRELDPDVAIDRAAPALDFGDGRALRRLRYCSPVDATGRDYLVWDVRGQPPIAALATTATAAMWHLLGLASGN